MTDRELLELAAKAAGVELRWHLDGTAYSDTRLRGYWSVWNPLVDDGDALKLVITLGMEVGVFPYDLKMTEVTVERVKVEEHHDTDPYAATRRAIVRAAAEIGKQMGGSDE